MALQHCKWKKSGRTFKTEKPNQFVYTSFIGQTNINVGGDFVPYLYDPIKKIIRFADCELHFLPTGLSFRRDGKNFDIAFYPETKKGVMWNRPIATISELSINEIHTEGSTDYLEVSYKLSTDDQESTVKVQVGGGHRAKLSSEIKAKVAGEQKLTLEYGFTQKPKQIYVKESLASEKEYLAGYEFDFCHLFWGKDEVEDHKPEETANKLKLHLKQGIYEKDEIKILSPTDWGPNQVAVNADDCQEETNGTYYESSKYGNRLYLSGEPVRLKYCGWRWDNVTVSGTIDNTSQLKLYNADDNSFSDTITGTLKGVEEADPNSWAADNKPSGKSLTTASEVVTGQVADMTITGADLASILQELVDTYTYSGTQALAMVMESNLPASDAYWSACWDYSKGNNEYGELKIVYTAAGGVAPTGVFHGPLFGPLGGPV